MSTVEEREDGWVVVVYTDRGWREYLIDADSLLVVLVAEVEV